MRCCWFDNTQWFADRSPIWKRRFLHNCGRLISFHIFVTFLRKYIYRERERDRERERKIEREIIYIYIYLYISKAILIIGIMYWLLPSIRVGTYIH